MDNRSLHILLVEDNPTDVLLLEEALDEVGDVDIKLTHASRLNDALERLENSSFDAVLLDLGLPDSQGLETFLHLHQHNPQLAILVLSGLDDDELATRAVQEGAQDYLIKGRINGGMLMRTMRYAIERSHALTAKQESQRFLQSTLDALISHIAVLDQDGTIIAVNKAWKDFFEQNGGDPRTCGVGVNYLQACERAEVFDLEEMPSMARGIREVMSGEKQEFTLEYPCHAPDRERWFVARVTRFYGEEPLCTVVAHENITERKLAESSLQKNETKFRTMFETSLDAILLADDSGTYIDANPAACVLMGLPRQELLGRHVTDFVRASTRELVATQFSAFLQEDRQEGEFEIHRPDGSIRYAEFRAVANLLPGTHMSVLRDITERKKAEEAQEAKTREIITVWESITDAFVAFDKQWRFTHINSQAEILIQANRDDVLGKNLWDEFSVAHDTVVYREYHRAVAEQVAVSFEEFYPSIDRWFEIHAYPSPVGLSVYFRDISARKQAEHELRESEARFQGIATNIPGMVYQYIARPDGSIEWPFISEGCREICGVDSEEIRRDPAYPVSLIDPEDRPSFDATFAASAANLSPWSWEGRIHPAAGETRWLQGNSRPRRLPDGGILWDGLLVDITSLKEAESERDRFFTMSLDMLAIANAEGYFTRLNPAWEDTLGFPCAELLTIPFIELVHPDDVIATQSVMGQLLKGDAVSHFENRYRCRDGSYKWLRWMCAPSEGLIYAVAHDITPVKRAESALLKANDELELRVMERTAELEISNREMYAAKQEADAANLAKSEFLSRMSHELRTPLNAILGFGQILNDSTLTAIQKESIGYVLKAGHHLLDLINEVLDIARVEAGHIQLSLEPISLADVVPECCALLRPLADARQISLDENTSALPHSYILADRQRIKQVLINLLSNGIKYNHPEGRVEVLCEPRPGGYIRISVRDTGLGIAAEDIPRLFTPFERLHAKDSKIEGTGLGLALSKRLVTAMDGTFEIESTPGEGSTFRIEFPQTTGPEERYRKTPVVALEAQPLQPLQREFSVLCIEDNASNLRLLEMILDHRPGITVIPAMQGSIGLDIAYQYEPDLILLDLNLPDMHGIEVLKRLQRSALTRDIPVAVISADATPSQVERLLEAGAKLYLTKPLNVAEFLQTIDTLFRDNESVEPETQKEEGIT